MTTIKQLDLSFEEFLDNGDYEYVPSWASGEKTKLSSPDIDCLDLEFSKAA